MILQLASYRFHWRVTTPLQLPPYAGSTLRGVFGHALRRLSCLTGADHCQGCAVLARCPYPQLFEPQSMPRPVNGPNGMFALTSYAIETPFAGKNQLFKPGEHYHFDMVLIPPQSTRQLPLITEAMKQAFQYGVGPAKGRAELLRVELRDSESGNTLITLPQFDQPADIRLHFQTPLRLQQNKQLVSQQAISAALFLRHLIRRVSFQLGAQCPDYFGRDTVHALNALADTVKEGKRELQWYDWGRYSSRQKRSMKLGGLIGYWEFQQVPAELHSYIYLGQWLHVGKETAFGLGKYQWLKDSPQARQDSQACQTA